MLTAQVKAKIIQSAKEAGIVGSEAKEHFAEDGRIKFDVYKKIYQIAMVNGKKLYEIRKQKLMIRRRELLAEEEMVTYHKMCKA
jgi:hypothetical protein